MVTIQCGDRIFENIQAIIFDKDGTLAHSEHFLRNLALRRSRLIDAQIPGVGEPLLMAFGVESDRINPAGLTAVGTRRENEVAAAAYITETGRDWIESLQIASSAFAEADRYLPNKAQQTPLFAGMTEVLRSLFQAGVLLGILSSDTTENVMDFAKTYDIDAYFQLQMGVVGGLSKPDPRLFYQACEALGTLPAQTLTIGDSAADFEMGRNAGAAGCVGVKWGWTQPPRLEKADLAIAKFDEIRAIR